MQQMMQQLQWQRHPAAEGWRETDDALELKLGATMETAARGSSVVHNIITTHRGTNRRAPGAGSIYLSSVRPSLSQVWSRQTGRSRDRDAIRVIRRLPKRRRKFPEAWPSNRRQVLHPFSHYTELYKTRAFIEIILGLTRPPKANIKKRAKNESGLCV